MWLSCVWEQPHPTPALPGDCICLHIGEQDLGTCWGVRLATRRTPATTMEREHFRQLKMPAETQVLGRAVVRDRKTPAAGLAQSPGRPRQGGGCIGTCEHRWHLQPLGAGWRGGCSECPGQTLLQLQEA